MSVSMTHRERCITAALAAHSDALRHFVSARVPATEVDDILQNSALRALEAAASLDDETRVRAWLFTIHRNLITDTLRQLGRHDRLAEALLSEPVDQIDVDAAPCDCSSVQASRLQPAYAAVLDLVDAQGASVAEAAEAFGISTNNTRVRLHRARKALREAMKAHCGVEDADECMVCRCIEDECCAH